jgi:hypothetical protein
MAMKANSPAIRHVGTKLLLIHDLGARCWSVVSITPRTLFAPEKVPRYPLDKRLVGPQAGLDTEARGKNPLFLPGIEPRSSSAQSHTILPELLQLRNYSL